MMYVTKEGDQSKKYCFAELIASLTDLLLLTTCELGGGKQSRKDENNLSKNKA